MRAARLEAQPSIATGNAVIDFPSVDQPILGGKMQPKPSTSITSLA